MRCLRIIPEDCLLCFDRPNSESIGLVAEVLQNLQILPVTTMEGLVAAAEAQGARIEVCDLATATSRLSALLKADCQSMKVFTEEELAVEFCYAVVPNIDEPRGVSVWTRMFHPWRSGSISYGPAIFRKTENEYVLRIFDG
jgi:hypothetical protein